MSKSEIRSLMSLATFIYLSRARDTIQFSVPVAEMGSESVSNNVNEPYRGHLPLSLQLGTATTNSKDSLG